MANRLKVAKVLSIQALDAQGWSQRRIAWELGIDRATVARYLKSPSKPAKAPIGSGAEQAQSIGELKAAISDQSEGDTRQLEASGCAQRPPLGLDKRGYRNLCLGGFGPPNTV